MKRKILSVIIAMLLFSTVQVLPVSAAVEVPAQADSTNVNGTIIVPYADVIEVRYRTYKGRRQYRRWNLSKNRWEDPYWINM